MLGINLTLIVYSTPISFLAYPRGVTALETLCLFRDCIDFDDPEADGWGLLSQVGNAIELSHVLVQYPQFTRDWVSFLLSEFRAESTASADYFSVVYALWCAAQRKEIDGMNLILEFDPQREIQASMTAIDYLDGASYPLILCQVLAEKGIDIQNKYHRETPTSQSLRVSSLFFSWRDDARLLYPNIDCLVEHETSEKRTPSLRGWRFYLLRDLFVLDKPESQNIDVFYLDYFQPLDDLDCLECNDSARACDIDDDSGFIIEPWLEGLKYTVKSRKCLCSMNSWVQDGRDEKEIIHKSCFFENTDSNNNSQLEVSFR